MQRMQNNNICNLPDSVSEDDIFKIFIEDICQQNEVWIKGEPFLINIDYKITDCNEKTIEKKEKIEQEIEGNYTQSPVLEINNVQAFKTALFEYVKSYENSNTTWSSPDIAGDWKDTAMYAMLTVWTNATNSDFTNPIQFLKRYTDFLTQDQWDDLAEAKREECFGIDNIWKKRISTMDEMEAPNNYCLLSTDKDGKECYSPSIVYGIQDDKAFIYAIQKLYGKSENESNNLLELRNRFKGRVEPLAVAALISFMQEAKQRGISKIVMPDNFVLRYICKIRIINQIFPDPDHQEIKEKHEENADNAHRGSLDNRLYAMFLVSKKYSTGLKFLEIPGEVSDNLTVDIQDFKIGREQPEKKAKKEQEER